MAAQLFPAGDWFLPVALLLVTVAMIWDLAIRRIPNLITVTAMAAGLAGHAVAGGPGGLAWSALGFAVGLGLLLIPFLAGGMGAGDVKLMAALGALLGPRSVFEIGLVSAIAGGVLALAVAARNRAAGAALRRTLGLVAARFRAGEPGPSEPAGRAGSIPYGLAIGVGTWICLLGGGVL